MQDLENEQTQSRQSYSSDLKMSGQNLEELQEDPSEHGQLQTFLKLKLQKLQENYIKHSLHKRYSVRV